MMVEVITPPTIEVGQIVLRFDLAAQRAFCGVAWFQVRERFRRLTLHSATGLSQRDKPHLGSSAATAAIGNCFIGHAGGLAPVRKL